MKKIFCCLCFLVFSYVVSAQGIKFTETIHEFYHIQEVNGTVSHQFLFTNVSAEDVVVKAVVSNACPCLSFTWPQTPIQPKAKNTITIKLDPTIRNGMFAYPITVTTIEDGKTVNYELMVKGYIVPIPKTKEEEYPMMEGHLRYKNYHKSYVMHREETVLDTFHFYNVWDSAMTFTYASLPPCIQIINLTKKLQPKEEGYVVFTYNAAAKNDYGPVNDRFIIITNDPERPNKTFYITGDIYDNFSKLTPEELENAPHIFTEQDVYDFGTDTSGKEIRYTFTIKNTGKSNLLLRKVKTYCGCTTSKLIKNELAPGESMEVEAIFRSGSKTGYQMNNIDVISNDPDQPKLTLQIKGNLISVPKR